MPQTVRFRLNLSKDAMLAHYQGAAAQVSVQAEDGRRIQFPAIWLRRFVTDGGVAGRFEMHFGDDNRLVDLQRIAD
jgi:hypothetical protein